MVGVWMTFDAVGGSWVFPGGTDGYPVSPEDLACVAPIAPNPGAFPLDFHLANDRVGSGRCLNPHLPTVEVRVGLEDPQLEPRPCQTQCTAVQGGPSVNKLVVGVETFSADDAGESVSCASASAGEGHREVLASGSGGERAECQKEKGSESEERRQRGHFQRLSNPMRVVTSPTGADALIQNLLGHTSESAACLPSRIPEDGRPSLRADAQGAVVSAQGGRSERNVCDLDGHLLGARGSEIVR